MIIYRNRILFAVHLHVMCSMWHAACQSLWSWILRHIISGILYDAYSKDKLKPNVTNILYEHVISSKIVTFENGYTNKAVTITNVNKLLQKEVNCFLDYVSIKRFHWPFYHSSLSLSKNVSYILFYMSYTIWCASSSHN